MYHAWRQLIGGVYVAWCLREKGEKSLARKYPIVYVKVSNCTRSYQRSLKIPMRGESKFHVPRKQKALSFSMVHETCFPKTFRLLPHMSTISRGHVRRMVSARKGREVDIPQVPSSFRQGTRLHIELPMASENIEVVQIQVPCTNKTKVLSYIMVPLSGFHVLMRFVDLGS